MYTDIKKAFEDIEKIRNATVAQYEFPYYALVRVAPTHGPAFHIPAPWFEGAESNRRSHWAGNLPIAQEKRDGEYYHCPFCGEPSFYAGPCQDCLGDFAVWKGPSENEGEWTMGEWVDGPLPIEYENHNALKNAMKTELLRRLDEGIKDLGIQYAEIVLPVEWGAELDASPFLKRANFPAERALSRLTCLVHVHKELEGKLEYEKLIHEFQPENCPECYTEGEEIDVEGSTEIRRFVNGIWQHKHPDDGYDYWHPMTRIHKGQRVTGAEN